ncbi:uncharacterized protein [Physcomitrium patens]|uniref:Uncharacterized protein n=1 Tax=Physcomitrium patens TaxID=3218 RepID=A0A2K1KW75_PHYPA|nr:WD repeat-containing protein 70-like isoform X2 [Physcomitrium patens]PNR58000.1 hypothetical protein PHYPA_004995 [Physcomitrium patens]|eukprot:XP_024370423.1 WD repeat-containing protein 70-like isoform X2 [Physcomitrella patens]
MADDDSGQPKNRHLPQSNADEKNGDIANPIKQPTVGARLTQGRTGGLGVGHLGVKMLRSGENPTKDDDGDDDDDDDADDDEIEGAADELPGDEADIHDGLRTHFPLSFGKQEAKAVPLESIHSKTKRGEVVAERLLLKSANKLKSEASRRSGQIQFASAGSQFYGPPRPPAARADEDIVGPPRPETIVNDEDVVGPPRPPATVEDEDIVGPPHRPGTSSTEDEDGGEDEADEDDDEYRFPLSNEIVLKGHTKVVTAIAVDPTGSRVLTGGYDYSVRMYDFQGMNAQLRSFRQIEPSEGHQLRALSWSPTADQFIAVTGSATAKIYDRDGFTQGEFVKGDMYIRDLKNTKGHISGLTGGHWHPKERQTALTSSEDGSLRIWDVTNFKTQKQVVKPKLARPGRVSVTACAWGLNGNCVAGGLADGSIQIWNVKAGWGSRPDIYISNAHENGDDVTSLCFSGDGNTLLSRSTDSTVKVWDVRKPKAPLKTFGDLPNSYAQTTVSFSPDERLIMTGTSTEKEGNKGGLLVFFDRQRLEFVRRVGVSADQSVVCSLWHPKLNQIFATTGDKKRGGTHVLYDPAISEKGALVCVARAPRKKSIEDMEAKPVVHNPHALPLFRDAPSRKRAREKARNDPIKSKRPDLPMSGPGFGGRVGTTKGSLLTQYLMREGGMIKETWMDEDPREAILKHADAAAKDPTFFGPAYAETQPQTIFHESDEEEEDGK